MTRDEVKQVLMLIEVAFPSFNIPVEKKKPTVALWEKMLAGYSFHDAELALQSYITTSGSAFAPSLPEIIKMINKPAELSTLSEGEAWSLVSKALRNSTYHSQEEFDKLPEDVQKTIGAASQLHAWATDEHFSEGVVMSNFQRAYNIIVKRRLEVAALPQEVRAQIEEQYQNLIGMN